MRCIKATILGVPVAFHAPEPLSEDVCRALAPRVSHTASDGGAEVTYELREGVTDLAVVRVDASDCVLVDTARSIDQAAELIANDLHRWVAEHHPDLLFIHAGAVEWHGAGVVVPGRSYSGKSSLVAALLEAGARYLSDEFAPLDRDGNVHPYPRHLSLRDGEGTPSLVPAAAFAARTATEPMPVRYVVDAPYVPGASFSPVQLRGAGPLMILAYNALVARSRPAHTIAILAGLAPHVTVLRSARGDAAAAARAILDAIDADRQLTR